MNAVCELRIYGADNMLLSTYNCKNFYILTLFYEFIMIEIMTFEMTFEIILEKEVCCQTKET